MSGQKENLNIRLLNSYNASLSNQEFKLFEIKNAKQCLINTLFTTNENGEVFLNTKEVFSQEAQSFELALHNSIFYKSKPIYNHRFILRSYEYGHWCEIKFEEKIDNFSIEKIELKPKEFTLDNGEKIRRNFYTNSDELEFEAFYDDKKVKEEEIKWGYLVITRACILDKLNKNQLTNDKKENHLFDEEILQDCFQIEKIKDEIILSNTAILRYENNEKAYKGKTIKIKLSSHTTTNTKEQKALLIFAYKNIPNYRASQLIRLNDYPQITIDCTLAETLRAHTKKDLISRLGWGVSYICQRLWHDNPSDAENLDNLTFTCSKSQNFIDTIANETMKAIVKDELPEIKLKEFSKENEGIASTIQDIKNKNLRFYIELDWDEFYLKFPLIKGLEKEMLSIQTKSTPYSYPTNTYHLIYNGKILTEGFLAQIRKLIESKKDIIMNTQGKELNMQVTANLSEIAKNPKEANIPNINNKIFFIKEVSQGLQKNQKPLNDIQPKDLRRYQMQYYAIPDTSFGEEYFLNFGEKSKQVIALYALSGKFQIYYVLDTFEAEKLNGNKIAIYPTQIKAYVDDSFDFRDQDHIFNADGSIVELGQPVGAWDYNEMKFDISVSFSQMSKYTEKDGISVSTATGATIITWLEGESAITIEDYKNYKAKRIYANYNHEYQQTQKYFNLGLDFLVASKTFKDIKISKEVKVKNLFKIIVDIVN